MHFLTTTSKRYWLLLGLLFSFFIGIAQTTVTLQDQCNCEVLKGTDVSSSGQLTPNGADLGDLYVNTTTGAVFYWNGTSWQFTSNGTPYLQNVSFDTATNLLAFSMSDGSNWNADLSILDTPTAADITFDNSNSSIVATNVQEAIDEVSQRAFAVPSIYATGKINPDGSPAVIHGASVQRLDEGDYQITFNAPLVADYVIQVSVLDCNGDCPGNGTVAYDSPSITYYDQSPGGFKVNIGDSDNGAIPKDDIDIEFMFTTITIPLKSYETKQL